MGEADQLMDGEGDKEEGEEVLLTPPSENTSEEMPTKSKAKRKGKSKKKPLEGEISFSFCIFLRAKPGHWVTGGYSHCTRHFDSK